MRIILILSYFPNPYKKFQTEIHAKCLSSQSNELTHVVRINSLLHPSIRKLKNTISLQNLQ